MEKTTINHCHTLLGQIYIWKVLKIADHANQNQVKHRKKINCEIGKLNFHHEFVFLNFFSLRVCMFSF